LQPAMASNDFASLLSTFKAATGAPSEANASNRGDASGSVIPSGSVNGSSSGTAKKRGQHDTSAGREKKDVVTGDTTAATASEPARSLLSATTDLWRIAEIRRSAGIANESKADGSSIASPKAFRLAICACVVDSFPHEDVWRRFMRNDTFSDGNVTNGADGTKISASAELYVHAKHPDRIRSSWARSKTIAKSYKPDWNDVRIVRAMLALAEEALKDGKTTHILFATESCIPIGTLAEVARRVVVDEDSGKLNWDRSFVDAYGRDSSRCTRFDERNCWDVLTRSVPSDAICKALPGWCLLSRRHVEGVLGIPQSLGQDLWPAFEDAWAPEEVYFPTCLSLLGYMTGGNVVKEPLTYAEWNERAKDHRDRAHPLEFDGCFERDEAFLRSIKRDGCMFLRKVKRPIPTRLWEDVVLGRHSSGGGDFGNVNSVAGRKRHRDDTEYQHFQEGSSRYERRRT